MRRRGGTNAWELKASRVERSATDGGMMADDRWWNQTSTADDPQSRRLMGGVQGAASGEETGGIAYKERLRRVWLAIGVTLTK